MKCVIKIPEINDLKKFKQLIKNNWQIPHNCLQKESIENMKWLYFKNYDVDLFILETFSALKSDATIAFFFIKLQSLELPPCS